mgnify:CR=1 FL=1
MVSPFGAVIIGTICGILMIYSVEFIDRTLKIDDPVGASSVHGVCGFTGTILTGLFSTSEGLFYGAGWSFLGAQVFGALVVGAWAAGMGFIIFKTLDRFTDFAFRHVSKKKVLTFTNTVNLLTTKLLIIKSKSTHQ